MTMTEPTMMGAAITTDRVIAALTSDLSLSYQRGTLRSLTMNPRAPGFLRTLAETPKRQTRPPAFTPRLGRGPITGNGRNRDLTPGEAVWFQTLSANPAEITDRDVTALEMLAHEARSPAERSLLTGRLEAIQAHEKARGALHQAEMELMRLPTPPDPTRSAVWPEARRFLADRIRKEVPQLDESEAETRATRLVQEAWKPNSGQRNDLRARIGQLCRDHNLAPHHFQGAERWGLAGDDNRTDLIH